VYLNIKWVWGIIPHSCIGSFSARVGHISIKKLYLNIQVMKNEEINGDKIKINLNDLDGHIFV